MIFSQHLSLRSFLLACLMAGATHALATKTYSDNIDGTVTDPSTGLTWMRCAVGQTLENEICSGDADTFTFDEASALTKTQMFAGKSDWRVPHIRELLTIVDRSLSALTAVVFPNTPGVYFWTSSLLADSLNDAWFVNFGVGGAGNTERGQKCAVRLVRGEQSRELDITRPDTDYVDQGDGTVLHTPTGLVWQRCAVGQTWGTGTCSGTATPFNWHQAMLLTSDVAGKTDWRIPSEDELLTLVDYKKFRPSLNARQFPNTPIANFWSSLPVGSYYAWVVGFPYGVADGYLKIVDGYHVRFVRAGHLVDPYALTIQTSGVGTVRSSAISGIDCGVACTGNYTPGTTIVLNATPTENFIAWGDACSGTQPTCTVTMDKAKTITARFTHSPALSAGWNLLGSGIGEPPWHVADYFGDSTLVNTVWKWDVTKRSWQYYTPLMDSAALQTYATLHGYTVLGQVRLGEGFWVHAKKPFVVHLPGTGTTAIQSREFQAGKSKALTSGWNLIAIGNTVMPSTFNADLSVAPADPLSASINLKTLWAWDSLGLQWYFYSPSIDSQGATTLSDFITKMGYQDFIKGKKTLMPGMGFWVNK